MGNQATKEYSKYHRHADGRKKNVHWEEAERPHPPGQPLLVPASPGAQNDVVTIRWDPPISDGGSAITGYLVEHRRTGSPHWVRATPGAVPRCQLTLSGLEPGWRYQFRVAAENAAGRSDPSAVSEPLTVTLAKGVATAPHFSKELQDTVALENEKVELTVRVTGTPAPKISWFKDGLEVFSGRRSRVVTDGEGTVITSTLIIHQAALADEGEIKCAATNRAGHAVTKARLRLEAPPSIRLPRQYEDGLLFELGEVIRVKVSVAGRPPPRVSWLHNGEVMRPGPRHEITTTDKGASLRVSEARRSDRGEYQVRAVNQLGEDVSAFLVTVTDRPTPPGKAMVAMTLGKSVTLNWGPPDDDGGCKIGNYIVEYYRVGWDMWLKAATCRQLTTTLGDLIEGSEYKFRVKAENPYGVSDPGDESETVFIPDPKRGIHDPPQRGADGSEQGSDWWNDRKRRRDPGAGASSEDADDALDEKKARPDGAATATGNAPARKRAAPLSMDVEDVSPIPSPVPRVSRATEKSLSLPRTRSAAPGAATPRDAGAPEPPKRRNRSVPRSGDVRDDSVSPEPDSMGSYLPTSPDEMGVVKGRLFGIHLSTDSVRSKHAHAGIEEEVYPPLASPRPSPARSPVPSSPPTSPSPGLSPGRSPRRSPIGGGEVTARPEAKPEAKPEANGVLDLRQVEEYANKYEAKLMELERRQRELEARGRQRQLELEEEQKKELERMRKDREWERERERSSQLARNKEAPAKKEAGKPTTLSATPTATPAAAPGQDRLFPRSEDGSVTGDSSEFLLVLLPNSRATTEERETTRSQTVASLRDGVDADGEPPVAPPMSLSAPELGAIDPDVPFMRNAVSSTELLHERAMARFYQEVAEEEAEKARRRRMSIERRVSLERRLSIERKNRERLKGRMDSVDEDAEDDLPVNLKRFATARPSGAAPAAPASPLQPRPGAAKAERVLTSEEREQADFAALRDRLSKATKSEPADSAARRRREQDLEDEMEDELDGEELGEEEEDEDLEEEEEEDEDEEEEDSALEEEDVPLGRYDDDQEETYHPRFGARLLSEQDDTPPTPPPHRKASSPEPEVPLFIPRAETYTTMTEHDNVASVLLTKRHSPVKGDVKPKPILKKRGSIRKSKSPGSKSPGSKSPGSKSPQRHKSPTQGLSPMIKKKDKLERRKSTDSADSDKSEKRRGKKAEEAVEAVEAVRMRPKPERPPPDDDKAPAAAREAMATATPEANLGISAAEAARSKRGLSTAPRRDSLKDDATKVVISHYSDLVREYGAQKPQQPKYLLSYDEIRARAEADADADDSGSTERVGPAGAQRAVLSSTPASTTAPPTTPTLPPEPTATLPVSAITSSSVREDLLARRESRREPSVSRKESRREPSAARRDTAASKADGPATRDVSASSSRRREPSSSRTREPSVARKEPSRRDASTSRREPSVSRRDASVSKRDASVSKRDSSVSKRDGSVSRRDGSVSRRDGSVSRRDGSVVRRPGGKEALGYHPYHRDRTSAERSLHRSHTSVASSTYSDDFRARTPEEEQELVRRAEENVKSTFRYATDLGMLVLAVWLYLFRSELLALPVLGLLVYRQAKEEVRRRVRAPAWLARVSARVRALGALGRGKATATATATATDAAGAATRATNPATR